MKRIFIIDDSAHFLTALWMMLSDEFDVSIAYSGFEYARIKQITEPFDHILMDNRMPGIRGLDAIRKLSPEAGEKITIMTANDFSGLEAEVLALREIGYNMTQILKKPFHYKDVRNLIGG
jgi:DNA-binding response OmpR family regulator